MADVPTKKEIPTKAEVAHKILRMLKGLTPETQLKILKAVIELVEV